MHINGLFVWLMTVATGFHLNFVHTNGVWSSHASENPDMCDAIVMHVEGCFVSALSQLTRVPKEEVRDGFMDLQDTMDAYVGYPVVLTGLVWDLKYKCDETGLQPRGYPCPLQILLVELSSLVAVRYWVHLVSWMRRHSHALQFAHWWCNARGLDFGQYRKHLLEGGAADGLEVLLASVAMDTRINLVFEDTVWSTSADGPDFKFPTIILTLAGAVACLPMDTDSGNVADIDTSKTSESPEVDSDPVPSVLTKRKRLEDP